MSARTKTRTLARAATVLALAVACESDITVVDVAVEVQVTPAADTLAIGITRTPFRAFALNLDGDTVDQNIRWSTLRSDIATVDSLTGAVTGVAAGETRVVARAGSLADTATLTVLGPVTLGLRLDTILLMPGDTFTIPRTALGAQGEPISPTFAGADTLVARVSPTGFVQAIGAGRTTFTMSVDSSSVGGVLDVVSVDDTTDGQAYVRLTGDLQRRARLPSRWFQYPATTGGSVLNLAARNAADTERVLGVLRDSLTAVDTRNVGRFPEGVDGTTAVCDPPNSWMVYQDRRAATIEATSTAGTILIQRLEPIPGGQRVSATVDITLERINGGPVGLYGRFVVPLLSLPACPS